MPKSAPAAPNYGAAAVDQGKSAVTNVNAQTQANRPDQNSAYGSTQWSQDANGNWTQTQSLNQGEQGLLDKATQNQLQGIDYSALPELTNGADARDQAIQGAYSQATSRLDPQFQQAGNALRTQLYNSGLREGDAAYDQQMDNFGRQKNDAYTSAMNGAIAQGTAAGQSLFNQSLQGRQQALGEATQQMNQPLQGLNSILSGSSALQMPSYMGAGVAAPINYLGAAQSIGNYNLQNTAQQNQMYADMFSAGGQLGAAGIKAI